MDPLKSWALVCAGGALVYYYYSRPSKSTKPIRQTNERQKLGSGSRREDKRGQDSGLESQGLSGNDHPLASEEIALEDAIVDSSVKARKKKKKSNRNNVIPAVSTPVREESVNEVAEATAAPPEPEEIVDNIECARQLTERKTGTPLSSSGQKPSLRKPKKQNRVNGSAHQLLPVENTASAGSSTTGADADDDLSPAMTPVLAAKPDAGKERADQSVADMLEAPSNGPTVLRLTDPLQPSRARQQKSVQASTQETKKQRQNRKKAEEKKAARKEGEQERRVLLEKQLRTAREAEGRPAKNGLAPAKAPATSAWASSSASNGNGASSSISPVPLLDTFEDTKTPDVVLTPERKPTAKDWERDLPSEEEQLRLLAEADDSSWNTVSKKVRKKTSAVAVDHKTNESFVPTEGAKDSDWAA